MKKKNLIFLALLLILSLNSLFAFRYYDPQIARWTTVDPADQFLSPYVYCNNTPIMMVDPDGKIAYVFYVPQPFIKDVHLFIAIKNEKTGTITTKGLYPDNRLRVIITTFFGKEDNQIPKVHTNRDFLPSEIDIATDYLNGEKVKATLVGIIQPPEGMTSEEFDALIIENADNYPVNERPYNARTGYNSNTFVDDVIENSGGVMPDVPNATQQNYGEENAKP